MIKVIINKNQINITGHALYDTVGKDIVCASVSSIIYTTVNALFKQLEIDYPKNIKIESEE